MEEHIKEIIDLAHQKLDTYGPELTALCILKRDNKEPITDYELIEARNRIARLLRAIDDFYDD